MAAKKRIDPVKQREKRAKIMAAGGCVLLLLVAAWQVPKMLKLMNKKPVMPPPAAAPVTPGATGVDAAGQPTAPTAPGQLVDTDVPFAPADGAGELVSFDVFETKDPFKPQVTDADVTATEAPSGEQPTPAAATPTTTVAVETTAAPETPAPETPATAVPPTPVAVPSSTTPTTTAPVRPRVSISVNGVVSKVARDGTFPSAAPVFRLVSWTKKAARIGIVGGSYATGDPTLALELGKAVTLENTSDGQRYKLVLLSTP